MVYFSSYLKWYNTNQFLENKYERAENVSYWVEIAVKLQLEVLNVCQCGQELIENAIDAGSSQIMRLKVWSQEDSKSQIWSWVPTMR